jgi:hypothetical protein
MKVEALNDRPLERKSQKGLDRNPTNELGSGSK